MRRDDSHQAAAFRTIETEPQATTAGDEIQRLSDAEADETGPSLVDPLSYAPLVLVGVTLIMFPKRSTTVIGVPCLLAGLLLAVVDARSPDNSS